MAHGRFAVRLWRNFDMYLMLKIGKKVHEEALKNVYNIDENQ